MAEPQYRILVVDDYEPWRQFLCSTIRMHPQFQVTGQATDGLEAVRQAQELQPDLILLDVGLPTINGIEAARRIRQAFPKAMILFISENRSTEIAEEALRSGGSGYVIKSDAGTELMPAIETVLEGRRFVSASLHHLDRYDADRGQAAQLSDRNNAVAPTPDKIGAPAHHHEAGFYTEDRWLLDDLTRFIGSALKAGDAAIVIATESHCVDLLSRLRADVCDIETAITEGRYLALDATGCLPTFVVDGVVDTARFTEVLGNLILTATKATTNTRSRVALFGECCFLLWAQGNPEAAIQAETVGNQLVQLYDIDILCGYSMGRISGELDNNTFTQICMQHTAVHTK
jgi:DNA-binding NarL/FixJ family response regulator